MATEEHRAAERLNAEIASERMSIKILVGKLPLLTRAPPRRNAILKSFTISITY